MPTISRGNWEWCSQGTAGPRLLDSYETERKPQCELIVEQAYARYIKRVDPSLPATNLAPLLDDAAIELGSVYSSDAILDEEQGRSANALLEDPRNPSGRPGTRVPHIMLQRNGVAVSTLDLPESGFALLAGAGGRSWTQAADALAAAANSPEGSPDRARRRSGGPRRSLREDRGNRRTGRAAAATRRRHRLAQRRIPSGSARQAR